MKKSIPFFVLFGILILFMTSCTSEPEIIQPVEVTRLVNNTVVVTQVVYQVITATQPTGTATIQPSFTLSNTPAPSQTPTLEAVLETATHTPDLRVTGKSAEDVFSLWCAKYPGDTVDAKAPWEASYDANTGITIQDYSQIIFPNAFCVVVFQPGIQLGEGSQLSIYEFNTQEPWLTTTLTPVEGSEGVYYAVLNHPYVVNPPLWFVSYQFKLIDSDQQEIWSRMVEFSRGWLPKQRCWDGNWPDPITLKCQTQPEWEPIHTGFWEYKETVDALDNNE